MIANVSSRNKPATRICYHIADDIRLMNPGTRQVCDSNCRKEGMCCGCSSDCSPQRRHIRAPPYRTAPPCARPAPAVFSRNIPSRAAFLGRAVFLCTVPLSLLSAVIRLAQRKPPSGSVSMELSWGKPLESYSGAQQARLAKQVLTESYSRLMHSASATAHTPAKPDYKRQPMRWQPLRNDSPYTMIALAERQPLRNG